MTGRSGIQRARLLRSRPPDRVARFDRDGGKRRVGGISRPVGDPHELIVICLPWKGPGEWVR